MAARTIGVCAFVAVALALFACSSESADDGAGGSAGSGGQAGAAGSGGSAGACVPTTPTPPADAAGCDAATRLEVPEDTSARGPWPVGARLATIAGLPAEVWYPAELGTEQCKPKVEYDIREQLPDSEAQKIPDADTPMQLCDCYRDLPLDANHGPYPIVLMVHGTAAFRTLSLSLQTHWASRGFVVVAADHPGIRLKHLLALLIGQPTGETIDQAGDIEKMLPELKAPSGDLAFLDGHVDAARLGLAGHSAGGGAIAGFGDSAQVLIPLSAGGTQAGSALVSSLVVSGMSDGVVDFTSKVVAGYDASPAKKRLVGVTGAGHSLPTDLCTLGAEQGGILQIAADHGVDVPPTIVKLAQDGCAPENLSAEAGMKIVRGVTTAALEETLACSATATAQLANTESSYPDVGDFRQEL